MEWVKLTSASNTYEADLLAGLLQDAGIGTQTSKNQYAPGAWLTGSESPLGPIDVFVPSDKLDAARNLLPTETPGTETEAAEFADTTFSRRLAQVIGAILVIAAIVGIIAGVISAMSN